MIMESGVDDLVSVITMLGQLVGGVVALLVGGADQYLLGGLPGGVAAVAELVEKCHRAGNLPGRWPPPAKACSRVGILRIGSGPRSTTRPLSRLCAGLVGIPDLPTQAFEK